MEKPNGQSGRRELATHTDLLHYLGDMEDETAVAILAMKPTVAQLEEVGIWLDAGEEVLGKGRRPSDAVVAQILDLVAVEDEESPASSQSSA